MTRALVLAFVLQGAVLAPAAERPVLRVGMETRAAPWSFVPGLDYAREDFRKAAKISAAQLRKLTGFDVDVMWALAHRLGVEPRVVPVPWFELERGLLEKRYDLILSSWTPSVETPDDIVASPPYSEWGLLVAVRADNTAIRSYRDLLEGVKVGHYPDPAVERALEAMGRHGVFVTRDAPEPLMDDLKRGALDAVIYDSLYLRWRVSQDSSFRIVGEPLNRLGYHVGVRREDAPLFEKVQAAIRDLVSSPEMAEIRRKWEGAPGN